ncbi:MAG TPA: lactonase family protein [Terriglobales bacterium]|jgi:6-phosphogluconolactonase|nr:lactonase family protein [Terriglobales bacterium]
MKNVSPIVLVLGLNLFLLLPLFVRAQTGPKQYILYVGTYTTGNSKGIYAYRYNSESGELQPLGLAAATENPSFLASDKANEHLFAVNETTKYQGQSSGGVTAFSLDRKTGKLTQLNQVASRGADPCYVSLDRSGKYLLVANYTGGTVSVLPVLADGRLGEAVSVEKDRGTLGPNKERQDSPHAHWIEASARNRFVYVADLGLDQVLIYKFDGEKGQLSRDQSRSSKNKAATDFFSATLAPGTGPRHIAFSSDGKFMYVLGEMNATVTVFANDNETYHSIQQISSLPADFSGENTAAEIAMHPSGKFLYTSNRGADSIAEFSVDPASGKLTLLGDISTFGKTPRHFAIDPTGTRLLVANEDTGNIVEYSIDSATGKLTRVGKMVSVPSPVCLIFVPAE